MALYSSSFKGVATNQHRGWSKKPVVFIPPERATDSIAQAISPGSRRAAPGAAQPSAAALVIEPEFVGLRFWLQAARASTGPLRLTWVRGKAFP